MMIIKTLYECIVAYDGKIDNKFYSIKRTAMETIARVLTNGRNDMNDSKVIKKG